MSDIKQSTFKKAHKPFDIVTNSNGDIGFIQEVNVNRCQEGFKDQISYTVHWFMGETEGKVAWFDHEELTKHCNIFIEISKCACGSGSANRYEVQSLFNNFIG